MTYFDASYLVSLYSLDINSSAAMLGLSAARGSLWISTFAEFEFLNTLALRVFRKHDTPAQSQASLAAYDQDIRTTVFQLKPLPEHVFLRARQLSRQTTAQMGTRASDVLHVAAALELGADTFFTFGREQAKLAESVKLKINPQI